MSFETPRPARRDEIAALARLVAGHPLFERYGLTPRRVKRAMAIGMAAGDAVTVLVGAGRVLGIAWCVPRGGFGRAAYLRLLVVAGDATGRGVGSALMDDFEAAAFAEADDALLLVTHDNAAALRFYRRRGYRRVGRLDDFVKPGLHELILRKRRPLEPLG